MLLQFKFSNFRSFRKEQVLSLVASPIEENITTLMRAEGVDEQILPAAGIYGANASGKTNVLRALHFMQSAVRFSHRHWEPQGEVPLQQFRPEAASASRSRYSVDIVVDGVYYQYGFVATRRRFLKEWLHAYPNGRKQVWLDRNGSKPISFGRKLMGENRQIADLTRPNSLFLSAAAQNNHRQLTPVFKWFSDLEFLTSDRSTIQTARMSEDDTYRDQILSLLKHADLGVTGLRLRKVDPSDKQNKVAEALVSALEIKGEEASELIKAAKAVAVQLELVHAVGEESIAFAADDESEGTTTFLAILGPVLESLRKGNVLCIDELDSSLHPLLAVELVRLFTNPESNRNGAQLIFNTHDINLLAGGLLRRDQIWFTEKDRTGESSLYPLTDFKPRKGENLMRGYMQGRYGAIPFLALGKQG